MRFIKKVAVICLMLFVLGCAGNQWIKKESDAMLNIKAECKQKTMLKANIMSGWAINDDAYWQDILANAECRDFYEKCLQEKGYVKN